jgi:ubiquinone/menaquinone biosynthesis C-methylase UbiE
MTANPATDASKGDCVVPEHVRAGVEAGLGQFMSTLNGIEPATLASDMLDTSRATPRVEILRRFANTDGARILEVGSGFGTNLVVWCKKFGLDVTGVEPEGHGFSSTLGLSRELCKVNGVDPARIVEGKGEAIPFPDASFDIVYSAYALEHCDDPKQMLSESLRVLKPGGTLHFEIPNYLTPFEGHYLKVTPPVVWKPILPWYVAHVLRRDPGFAETMRTEINPFWLKRTMSELAARYPHELVTMGEDIFIQRLRNFTFEHQGVQSRISSLVKVASALNRGDLIAKAMVRAGIYYPLFLTAKKQ